MLKRGTLCAILAVGLWSSFGTAQKKRDLINEIARLKDSLAHTQNEVSQVRRQLNKSEANTALHEKENAELRDANATLLKNISSFSQVSKQNSETVNKALASLKTKEEQLKFITERFSKNDSIAIVILTQSKQTLGETAQVGVSNGDVVYSTDMDFLFEKSTASNLSQNGLEFLGKIGEIIKANPDRNVIVEGLNITGEFELTYQQAVAVVNGLLKVEGLGPDRISVMARDGNFKEGIRIRLTHDSNGFYEALKSQLK